MIIAHERSPEILVTIFNSIRAAPICGGNLVFSLFSLTFQSLSILNKGEGQETNKIFNKTTLNVQ